MRISESGVARLKQFEGLELEAYQDIAGVWTIGYGHTSNELTAYYEKPGMDAFLNVIDNLKPYVSMRYKSGLLITTPDKAEALLRRDLKSREDAVSRLVTVPLNQNEFDALVSFVYNVGAEAFRRSTALRRLNRGARLAAAEALTWWNKATVNGKKREVLGLTRRRAAEKALFLTKAVNYAPERVAALAARAGEQHRESNACPASESRPLFSYFPKPIQDCFR